MPRVKAVPQPSRCKTCLERVGLPGALSPLSPQMKPIFAPLTVQKGTHQELTGTLEHTGTGSFRFPSVSRAKAVHSPLDLVPVRRELVSQECSYSYNHMLTGPQEGQVRDSKNN